MGAAEHRRVEASRPDANTLSMGTHPAQVKKKRKQTIWKTTEV